MTRAATGFSPTLLRFEWKLREMPRGRSPHSRQHDPAGSLAHWPYPRRARSQSLRMRGFIPSSALPVHEAAAGMESWIS